VEEAVNINPPHEMISILFPVAEGTREEAETSQRSLVEVEEEEGRAIAPRPLSQMMMR
jgi:hypothetical protein